MFECISTCFLPIIHNHNRNKKKNKKDASFLLHLIESKDETHVCFQKYKYVIEWWTHWCDKNVKKNKIGEMKKKQKTAQNDDEMK